MATMDLSTNQEIIGMQSIYEYAQHVFKPNKTFEETDIQGNINLFNTLKTEANSNHGHDSSSLFQVSCPNENEFEVDNTLFSYSSFKKAMDLRTHNREFDDMKRTIFEDAEYFAKNYRYQLLPITLEPVDETVIQSEHNYSLMSLNSESEPEENCSRTMDYSQIKEKNYKRRRTKFREGNDADEDLVEGDCFDGATNGFRFSPALRPEDKSLTAEEEHWSSSPKLDDAGAVQPLDLSSAPLVQEEKTDLYLRESPSSIAENDEITQLDSDKENVNAELNGILVTITRPEEKENYQPCDLFLNDIARLVPKLIDKDCLEVDILDRTCDRHDEFRKHRLYYVISESTWRLFQKTNERVILTNDQSLGQPFRKAEKDEKPSYLVFDQFSLAKCLADYCQEIGGCFEYTCVEEEKEEDCLKREEKKEASVKEGKEKKEACVRGKETKETCLKEEEEKEACLTGEETKETLKGEEEKEACMTKEETKETFLKGEEEMEACLTGKEEKEACWTGKEEKEACLTGKEEKEACLTVEEKEKDCCKEEEGETVDRVMETKKESPKIDETAEVERKIIDETQTEQKEEKLEEESQALKVTDSIETAPEEMKITQDSSELDEMLLKDSTPSKEEKVTEKVVPPSVDFEENVPEKAVERQQKPNREMKKKPKEIKENETLEQAGTDTAFIKENTKKPSRATKRRRKSSIQRKPKNSRMTSVSKPTSESETSQKSDKPVIRKGRREPVLSKGEPPRKISKTSSPEEPSRKTRSGKVLHEVKTNRSNAKKKESAGLRNKNPRQKKKREEDKKTEETGRSLRSHKASQWKEKVQIWSKTKGRKR